MRRLVLLGAVSGLVSGCASLGGNVSGSFSCEAPDGICAPSAVIDDKALAMITGDVAVPGGTTTPAGPYREAPEARPAYRTAAVAPSRTRERVLRIVFQPYIDEQGRLHEKSAVHAVVERGDWQPQVLSDAAAAPSTQVASDLPRRQTETLADAVDRLELAQASAPALSPPDPATVAAARERGRDPVAAIKADVAARLATPAGSPTPAPADAAPRRVSAGAGQPAVPATTPAPRVTVKAGSFPAVVGED
ncbi:TraV family lipoprotein [Sphingomonas zeicaulis]|uniref:TraV family lipoprotein n=1 Tax=Sphingomonas zeicaulis TaxID=1632740 RepID=UPI003D1EDC03